MNNRTFRQSLLWFERSFAGRSFIVLLGSALGQAIAFLLLPIISRVYDADSIGRAAATLAFLSVFSFIATLQYDQAIIVAKDRELPYLMLLTALTICIFILVLIAIMIILNLLWLDGMSFLRSLGVNSYLLILLLLYPWFLVLISFRLRKNQLKRLGMGRFIYYGGGAIAQVAGGIMFKGNETTFLLAQGSAAFLAVAFLAPWKSGIRWFARNGEEVADVWHNVLRVAIEYSNFPKYQVGAQVFNAFSTRVPLLFLNAFLSSAWAGWYFMAFRLLAVPTALLSQAVGQVLYRDSAERDRHGLLLAEQTEEVVSGLIRISLLPAIALAFTAPFLVHTFLDAGWEPVGPILQILIITFVVSFFTSPVSTLLNVKGRQKQALQFNVLLFVVRSGSLVVAWFSKSGWAVIWGYTVASLLVLLPFFAYVMRTVDASIPQIIRKIRPYLIDTFIVSLVLVILRRLIDPDSLIIVIIALLSLITVGIREVQRVIKKSDHR